MLALRLQSLKGILRRCYGYIYMSEIARACWSSWLLGPRPIKDRYICKEQGRASAMHTMTMLNVHIPSHTELIGQHNAGCKNA